MQRDDLTADCFDWLRGTDEGRAKLSLLRESRDHLRVVARGTSSTIRVSPQVLALDVDSALEELEHALNSRQGSLWANAKRNLPAFERAVGRVKWFQNLNPTEVDLLEAGL
jgi:hypothetical protein